MSCLKRQHKIDRNVSICINTERNPISRNVTIHKNNTEREEIEKEMRDGAEEKVFSKLRDEQRWVGTL